MESLGLKYTNTFQPTREQDFLDCTNSSGITTKVSLTGALPMLKMASASKESEPQSLVPTSSEPVSSCVTPSNHPSPRAVLCHPSRLRLQCLGVASSSPCHVVYQQDSSDSHSRVKNYLSEGHIPRRSIGRREAIRALSRNFLSLNNRLRSG